MGPFSSNWVTLSSLDVMVCTRSYRGILCMFGFCPWEACSLLRGVSGVWILGESGNGGKTGRREGGKA